MKVFYGNFDLEGLPPFKSKDKIPAHLTVVGWEKYEGKNHVIVKCSNCTDIELYGEGYFATFKSDLIRGKNPCGCGGTVKATEKQVSVLVKRALSGSCVDFVEFVESFKGKRTLCKTYCNVHKTYHKKSFAYNIIKGNTLGCKDCANEVRGSNLGNSIDLLQSRLNKYLPKSKIVGYNRTQGMVYYTCGKCSEDEYVKEGLCSGVFNIYASSLKKGIKSCRCSVKFLWSNEQCLYKVNKKVSSENLKYANLGWIGDFHGVKTKIALECKLHGVFTPTCSQFLRKGICPSCADHGFDKNKSANIYVVTWSSGDNKFIKVGITNNESTSRISKQKSKTRFNPTEILSTYHDSGQYIKELETAVKKKFPSNYASKEDFPDGHTETFEYRYYQDIINFINSEMKNNNLTEII